MSAKFPRRAGGSFPLARKTRLWLPLLVVALLTQLVLTACGDSPNNTTSPATTAASGSATTAAGTSATTQAAAAPAPSGQTVTLTFGWWSNTPIKDKAHREWLDEFERTHPGIKINSEIIPWNNYWDKIKTTTAGGTAYDIIGMGSFAVAPYMDSDQFVDLNTFPDYKDAVKNMDTKANELFKWNGKQYGVGVGVAMPMMGYNKDLFTAAGVPFPDPVKPMNFEEFKTMAKKLTKTENGKVVQYAMHPSRLGIWVSWEALVNMQGGSPFDNYINPTKMTINTPEGIQGLANWKSLFDEQIVPPIDEFDGNVWSGGNFASLKTNKIAMARIGPWDFLEINTTPFKNIGLAPLFVGKERAPFAGINGHGIYKNSKHPKEAWEFIKWSIQTQPQTAFATFSDAPVDKTVVAQLGTVIKPTEGGRTGCCTRPGQAQVLCPLLRGTRRLLRSLPRGRAPRGLVSGQSALVIYSDLDWEY
jgi:multiple sugar transport system substrate-binding protein